MNVDKLKRLLSSIINTGVLTRKEDKTINDYMGIGFSHPTARNSLVSVHADSKGHRIEASTEASTASTEASKASKETEMLQDGKRRENYLQKI